MWKVFQPQLYNYHVSGNKILTSMIFATKSLKQQNSKWITSYCYCTINCTVLDCWLLSFFSYLLHVILSFYKLSCIEILSLYWSISAFMVYDSNQKSYTREAEPFCLGMRVWDFNCLFPTVQWAKGWGGSYAQSPCTKLSEGPWRHPRGRGHVGIRGTRGRWVQSQHQSRARASTHGCERSHLAPAVCCGAERSTAPKSVL